MFRDFSKSRKSTTFWCLLKTIKKLFLTFASNNLKMYYIKIFFFQYSDKYSEIFRILQQTNKQKSCFPALRRSTHGTASTTEQNLNHFPFQRQTESHSGESNRDQVAERKPKNSAKISPTYKAETYKHSQHEKPTDNFTFNLFYFIFNFSPSLF